MMLEKILHWKKHVSNTFVGLQFEFSGPRTPQRNGKVERKFQTLYGRIRAMFNVSGLVDNNMDFGQNAHLQRHFMKIELSTRQHNNHHCN
jgi:hypothetical protein